MILNIIRCSDPLVEHSAIFLIKLCNLKATCTCVCICTVVHLITVIQYILEKCMQDAIQTGMKATFIIGAF